MYIRNLGMYKCLETGGDITYDRDQALLRNEEIVDGYVFGGNNAKYIIKNHIANFLLPRHLVGDAEFANSYYSKIAETYDENLHITFDLYNEKEIDIRTRMIDLLNLKSESKVLEVSAGTGKDSEIIATRLGKKGGLWVLDITPAMLERAVSRLKNVEVPVEYIIGTACDLPFKDNSFDALYCFAGIGHFPDLKKGLQEMARVVKPGSRVVFCEKNVPAWLRNTTYGKILINNNPMFAYDVPLALIPIEARDLGIRWINGNVHYVVDYTVGDGEPKVNFDLELPGERGGTFNTRYFGQLEGVTPETKKLALKAREKLGISMHKWLDNLIKTEAEKIING
jgi:ubiquinone/menaquinone biosynthesis C-methylase UbiE